MQTTIKRYRKRKSNVDFAIQKTILKKDIEKQKIGAKSKNTSVKNAIGSLRLMKVFLECVTLLKQLLFQ